MLRGKITLFSLSVLAFLCVSFFSVTLIRGNENDYTRGLPDTLAINKLYDEGDSIFNTDIHKAEAIYRRAFSRSLKYKYRKGIAFGFYHLGTVYEKNLEITKAINYLEHARKLYQEERIKEDLPDCYGRIGLLYVKLGQPQKGLTELVKGLSLAEKNGDVTSQIRLSIVMAMHHNDFTRQYDKAIGYLKKAEQLNNGKTKTGKALLGHIYLQYAITYRNKKEYKKSLEYNSASIKLRKELNDHDNQMRNYLDRAETFYQMQDADGILRSVKMAEQMQKNEIDCQARANIQSGYAKAYLLQKKYHEALYKALSAADIMNKSNQKQALQDFRPLLIKLAYINGQIEKGDSVSADFIKEQDRLYSQKAVLADAEMRNKYEADKKDRQIRLQELNLSHQKFQTYSMEVLLILLIIISVIVYLRFLDRKKNNKLLAQKNLEIEKQISMLHKANEQKEMLIREVHHRVKNNLQIVSSLFNLQARKTEHPEVLKILNESKSRLKSIALIHNQLYSDEHLHKIALRPYVEQLAQYLTDIYKTGEKKIRVNVSIGNLMLNADTAVPLGLILTELITNSLKHAFLDIEKGVIDINISAAKKSGFLLLYADNGPGLPFAIENYTHQSLGMRLIINLSRQLSGSFIYKTEPAPRFYITFKESDDTPVKHSYS